MEKRYILTEKEARRKAKFFHIRKIITAVIKSIKGVLSVMESHIDPYFIGRSDYDKEYKPLDVDKLPNYHKLVNALIEDVEKDLQSGKIKKQKYIQTVADWVCDWLNFPKVAIYLLNNRKDKLILSAYSSNEHRYPRFYLNLLGTLAQVLGLSTIYLKRSKAGWDGAIKLSLKTGKHYFEPDNDNPSIPVEPLIETKMVNLGDPNKTVSKNAGIGIPFRREGSSESIGIACMALEETDFTKLEDKMPFLYAFGDFAACVLDESLGPKRTIEIIRALNSLLNAKLYDERRRLTRGEKLLKENEKELLKKTEALDLVTKEKYKLELQRDKLSSIIKEIEQETDAGLGAIAHTAKNMYMSQRMMNDSVTTDINRMAEIYKKYYSHFIDVENRQPNFKKLKFWNDFKKLFNEWLTLYKKLTHKNNYSNESMGRILEYILAVLAYQRGKEYESEGKYFTDLLKILLRIKQTHKERLERLNIKLGFNNHTNDSEVNIDKMYHFHLEEDVLKNLLTNSIRGLSKTYEKRIWIDIYKDGEYYEIHYRDNGKGIPEDKKKAIFEGWSDKIDKIGDIDSKTEHGLGGKTIYKRIHEAGGTIKEIGIPGEGAHFIIKLKGYRTTTGTLEKAGKKKRKGTNDVSKLKGKRILIVDDDKTVYSFISRIMDDVLIPMYAVGYDETMNIIFGTDKPDIITLDLDLRGMERGEKILTHLQIKGLTAKIPVIVVSGSDRAYNEQRLKALGAYKVIRKPVKSKDLRTCLINTLLEKCKN